MTPLAVKLTSGEGGSEPPSSGIGMLACDLQRSVNILPLLLDALQRTCLGVTLLAVKLMSGDFAVEFVGVREWWP